MAKIKKNKNKKNTVTSSPPNEETLIAICKKATNFLDKKKEHNANSEMEKIKHQYKSSAFFHHVNSAVKSALHFKSPNNFLLQESIVSAYSATILSPTSIDYSSNYVLALLHYTKNYDRATKECIRALAVKNPTVTYGSEWVNFYQEQLQNCLRKCQDNHFQMNKQLGFKDKELFNASSTKCIEVRETCSHALYFINRKEYQKAERFMQEESHGYRYAFGAFHAAFALVKYYNKRIQESISFARNATLLSQNNVEYSLFYIELLLISDFSIENFEEAAKECKRALAVNDPVDSFIDRFGVSEAIDSERILSYKRKIECIIPKITSPHVISITSFKEYCASVQNKPLENLLTKVWRNPRKLWFCPKCEQMNFKDSASQMSHMRSEHEHEYNFPVEFFSVLPQNILNVTWKEMIQNDSSKPENMLLKCDLVAESSLQYIWKYIFEENGNYELTDFAQKFKDTSDEKVENIKGCLGVGELPTPELVFESPESNDDDNDASYRIDYNASAGSLNLDHYAFPYKHIPSTFDNFNGGSREDKLTLGKRILSEWSSYKSLRKDEGKKLYEVIKENYMCLIKACQAKQDINFAYNTSIKLGDKSIETTEKSSMINKLSGESARYYHESADLESRFQFGSDEYFAFKICHTDAGILKVLARIQEYKKKVTEICVLDYSKVVVPLLKLYVQNQMLQDEGKEKQANAEISEAGN